MKWEDITDVLEELLQCASLYSSFPYDTIEVADQLLGRLYDGERPTN